MITRKPLPPAHADDAALAHSQPDLDLAISRSRKGNPAARNPSRIAGMCPDPTRCTCSREISVAGRLALSLPKSLIFTVGLAFTLLGCADPSPREGSDPPSPTSAAPSPAETRSTTAVKIDTITGGDTVELDLSELPDSPPGFTRVEVEAFADRAIDIIERGASLELQGKNPSRAFDYVFATQYAQTTSQARAATRAAAGTYDWEWAWASLFEALPAESPKFLTVRWQVDTVPGTRDDGSPAAQLRVVLATAVQHLIPDDSGGPTQPVVVQRTVTVVGFEPLGGSDWWPGIGIQTAPLFGGKCAPVNGSILTPAQRPRTIREDLKKLRDFLNSPSKFNAAASSDPSDLREYVDRYCER